MLKHSLPLDRAPNFCEGGGACAPIRRRSRARPAPSFNYDTIGPGYYDRVYCRGSGIQSKWHHLKFDYLRQYVSPARHHLDIGCGPGTFIGSLDESIRSVGVDVAAPQILYAKARYGTPRRTFELARNGRLPFDDALFDVITCLELIEHLPVDKIHGLLVEARRVLKPGGVLLVTTPDYAGLWPALEWVLNRLGDVSYEHQHITRFDRRRLSALLDQVGFGDNRVRRFQFLAPFAAAVGWSLADRVAQWEPRFLSARFGFLLLAEARRR